MTNLPCLRFLAVTVTVAVACTATPVWSQDNVSRTVIGPTTTHLADGAAALEAGRVQEGLRLTLEGLAEAAAPQEYAAGHSNACAAYVLLRQWPEALAQCNAALELDSANWRTYNNRASIYVEQGLYELAERDLEAGLALAPGAHVLLESLRILERNKKIMARASKRAVPS